MEKTGGAKCAEKNRAGSEGVLQMLWFYAVSLRWNKKSFTRFVSYRARFSGSLLDQHIHKPRKSKQKCQILFACFKWHTKENAIELHPVQFKLILGLQRGFLAQAFRRNWLKEQRDILNCKTFPTTCISSKIKILLPADLTLRRFCCTAIWLFCDRAAAAVRYAVKRKKRYYLGIFPNMGGGSSQIPKLL